jgi:hypothetical protein
VISLLAVKDIFVMNILIKKWGGKLEKLTDVEKRIFDKVVDEYKKRGLIADEDYLIRIIKLGNTEGDGFKRISRIGEDKTFLVPIEDIILYGVKAEELDKYEVEKKDKYK